MQAEQIAQALGNAKQANGSWLASCPVQSHGKGNGDKNPSLAITETQDGKYLFHCHGGCDQQDVFNAIKDRGLLPELPKREEIFSSLATLAPQPMTLEQEWEYMDEDRNTLFIKQRYKTNTEKGKDYRLVRVDALGRRHSRLGDVRIVPYRFPELLDAKTAGRAIYLVEGEKAADALVSIGAIATTSHAGAGHWPAEITQYFAGANVVVVPDNDKAGQEYAKKVIKNLLPVAKSVRYLDLDLPFPGDDAFEWVKMGGTRAELAALAKNLPAITETDTATNSEQYDSHSENTSQDDYDSNAPMHEESTKAKPLFLNIESWDTIQDEPVEWLIEKVIPKKSFVALYGPPGSYKSFIALDIAEAVATGRTWMGNEIRTPGAVLYICGEGHGGIGARIRACKIHNNTQQGAEIYVIRHQLNLRSSEEDFNLLMLSIQQLINETGVEFSLLQIDTLARAFGGGNENDSQDMGAFITNIGRVQRMLDCTIMILHHSGKDATRGLRGHSSLLGAVDTQLELLKMEGGKRDGIAGSGLLTISKQKDGADNIKIGFEMVEVQLSASSLGLEPVISLAVNPSDEATRVMADTEKKEKKPPLMRDKGGDQKVCIDSLHKAIKEFGEMRDLDGKRNKAVKIDYWKEKFKEVWGYEKTGKQISNKFSFLMRQFVARNKVVVFKDYVWAVFEDESEFGGDDE
jgi:hypothetical protein